MRWVALVFVLMIGMPLVQSQDAWQYAYITDDGQGDTLWLVDPTSLQTTHYPIPNADSWLAHASSSPDGTYVLLWFEENPFRYRSSKVNETSVLRLLNLQTGETRDIARLPYSDASESLSFGAAYNLVPLWSPDSRYISHQDRVYDVLTGGSFSLDTAPLVRAWSPDSTMLAVGQVLCHENVCYKIALSAFHVPDMTLVQSGSTEGWYDICDLNWSPDQTSIAFEVRCSYWNSGLFGYGEVMAWNLETNAITPLTDYTMSPQEYYELRGTWPDGAVKYSTLWVNTQSLLVSVFHSTAMGSPNGGLMPDPATFIVETALYHFPNGHDTIVSGEYVNAWASNPIHEQIAYQIETSALDETGDLVYRNGRTEIATFDGIHFDVEQTLPSGCFLAWSPDGEWLAFTGADSDDSSWYNCDNPTTLDFAVVDGSVALRTYPLPDNALPVGWVQAAAAQSLYFPYGTPTPIPTIVYTGAG
jgi:WD40 repeat protein